MMAGIGIPRSSLKLPHVILLTKASQNVFMSFHLIKPNFTKIELLGELDPFGLSFSQEYLGSKGLRYEILVCIAMSFNCTRRILKISFFYHCARNFSICQGTGL